MRLAIHVKTDLGLKALRVLAAEPRVWTANALAEKVSTTPMFIKEAMGAFVRAGWVYSGPGRSGGYLYASPSPPPSLLDVIESIEGPTEPDMCVLRERERCGLISGRPLCELHDGWIRACEVLVAVLKATPALDQQPALDQPPAPDQLPPLSRLTPSASASR
jgi:DNA-binding IscR family transcriptional regulator